ncbi:hypothetical protein Premu_0097 [Hallella multisaccharivorax DSM 17128]|uniref:Uncharacterized protein n=1 Tax=Hallella multisaccharivorax DSM 17128 TaxID=688246 RepID=F8N8U6_9BACT|nr:hypothetical protein Premu_0097 [Hallella multisaccharivorax DSM 17128]
MKMRVLSENEMRSTCGGGFINILTIRGAHDGVKGNTEIFLFGIRIYHGKNA